MLYGFGALDELGIMEGINEVIATTEKDGVINAAPLGIIRDGEKLYIRLFIGTHTYDNILENGWFVANISHDAWLFAETALEDITLEHFTRADGLPILKDAEAWILFKCEPFALDIIIAQLEPVKGEIPRIARDAGVDLVVSKWDTDYLGKDVQTVDLTMQLVKLYDPISPRAMKWVDEIVDKPLIDEDVVLREQIQGGH